MSAWRNDPVPPRLSTRWVRHCYWKYPLLIGVLFGLIVALAVLAGSPNSPRTSIAEAARQDPGGALWAFTQELAGTAPSWADVGEQGLGRPDRLFAIGPLQQPLLALGPGVRQAVARYEAAPGTRRIQWARAYAQALASITPKASMPMSGAMGPAQSPDYRLVSRLTGRFGPIPVIVQADLRLAESGALQEYLQSVQPGNTYGLAAMWLYDDPSLLNTALRHGLTDDQWGMIKERGFAVGPWYLIIPAVIHVLFPGGSNGTDFVLWNLAVMMFFLFGVPWLPGLRHLPLKIKLYRSMYRYPLPGELLHPANAPRPYDPPHGQAASALSRGRTASPNPDRAPAEAPRKVGGHDT